MNRLSAGAAAPAILAAAILAGCGSSSGSSSNSKTPTPAASSSQSSGAASAPAKPVTITTKHDKFGTVLAAGSEHRTVYLFEADKSAMSNCVSACASAWPPVIGKPKAANQALPAELSTISRPDGQLQVTYKGHPLYYFVRDKDAGDTYGQGLKNFGAEWYVLTPAGNKVDEGDEGS